MLKLRTAAIVAATATAALLASAGAASAAPTPIQPTVTHIAYEVDNGTTWTLSDRPVTSTGAEKGYADAGVVIDLGPASSFTGIKPEGTPGLAVNIWIADGSQATVPGTHLLSSTVNFDYGLGQPDGTWDMTGKHDAYTGSMLTDAQVRADFAGYQVLAWVGISSAGTDASGLVLEVNEHPALAVLALEAAKGKVTASADSLLGF